MNRKEKLLNGIEFANPRVKGIEIGALCRPILSKLESQVFYVDYANKVFLQDRYKADPNVNIDEIVEVDGIWGKDSLAQATSAFSPVDYVLASHVIEHVPDLISWLQEIESVLSAQGRLTLAIPDQRYTFDHARNQTRLADLLNAYFCKARVPMAREVMEHVLSNQHVDVVQAWQGQYPSRRINTVQELNEVAWLAQDIAQNGNYHDVHCWTFTPLSFCLLMEDLARLELINFRCSAFYDTQTNDIEFFAQLEKSANRDQILESWTRLQSSLRRLDPLPKQPKVGRSFKAWIRRHLRG